MRQFFAALIAFAFATPSVAEWREAQGEHFVVYADADAEDLLRFAVTLEQYHAAMAAVTGIDPPSPSPSNRIAIYVVGSDEALLQLAGPSLPETVKGFYLPRAGSSRAFVPQIASGNASLDFADIVFLHEYAHHFLMSNTRFPMPRWMNEGAAEFFASARFPRDGSVEIGRPANHRGRELQFAEKVTVAELVDPALYEKRRGTAYRAFYGRAWGLYHYLTFDEGRARQLDTYRRLLTDGKTSASAAAEAFGDLDALDAELDKYLKRTKMSGIVFAPRALTIRPVEQRVLTQGHAAAMPAIMRLQRGMAPAAARTLAPEMRALAERYPGDAQVFAALAEAERVSGDDDPAVAAADRALAIDPALVAAHVQKGLALFRKAGKADDKVAAYKLAMAAYAPLNKLENDHPLPLSSLYQSYVRRGAAPSPTARAALMRAAEIAPFDQALWMNVAFLHAKEGRIAEARKTLRPIIASAHGGRLARDAQSLDAQLAEATEGAPFRQTSGGPDGLRPDDGATEDTPDTQTVR